MPGKMPVVTIPQHPQDEQQQTGYGNGYDTFDAFGRHSSPPVTPPSPPPTAPTTVPPPPVPPRRTSPGPNPPGSIYDTSLASTPLPPPMPNPPGSIYDTNLASVPLPPTPTPTPAPMPTPPWAYGDRSVSSSQPPGPYQPDQAQQALAFESAVRAEIKQLESYFARQTKRFRLLGVATLVCAAAVPVLIAASAWSWLAAALGATAAITGSLQTLYRYQDSALSAMSLANSLESELVRYQTGTTPYLPGAPTNFNLFVDRTTNLRGEASGNFNGVWSSAQISTGG